MSALSPSYTDSELVSILEVCWTCLSDSRKSNIFWDVLKGFIDVAYLPCLLSMDEGSLVIEKLTEVRIYEN